MAEAKGKSCPRCLMGWDDDGDGNCAMCAPWSDEEVSRVVNLIRVAVIKSLAKAGIVDDEELTTVADQSNMTPATTVKGDSTD